MMKLARIKPRSKLTKVNLAWGAIIAVGLFAFVSARRSVDRNRLEVMRSKQRILEARYKDSMDKYGMHVANSDSKTNS